MIDKSLKNFYNQGVVQGIADQITATYHLFQSDMFIAEVMRDLPSLELKARSLCIAVALRQYLPRDYEAAVTILLQSMTKDNEGVGINALGMDSFRYLPFLNFIGHYGLEYPELSLKALYIMTKYCSGEFDIRPYLIKHCDVAFAAAYQWSKDQDWRVRRLASEGTRPRLPWGLQLKQLITDPASILPILDRLFNDPHPVVRRSVANSLNDISKNHSELAVQIATSWLQQDDTIQTRQTIKHALRTLRKKGDRATSKLLGIAHDVAVDMTAFSLEKDSIAIGECLNFNLTLMSYEKNPVRLVVYYVVHHQRKNGKIIPKAFKLVERDIKPQEQTMLVGKHSFKEITTRRYYFGMHKLEIQVGGLSLGEKHFMVIP